MRMRMRTSVVECEQNGGELEVEEEQLARGLRDELDERLRAASGDEARALVGRDVRLAEEAEQLLAGELEHRSRVRAVELRAPHAQAARRRRRLSAALASRSTSNSHSHSDSHTNTCTASPEVAAAAPRARARRRLRRRPLRFGGRGRRVRSRRLLRVTRGARRRGARALELEPKQVAIGATEALWQRQRHRISHT